VKRLFDRKVNFAEFVAHTALSRQHGRGFFFSRPMQGAEGGESNMAMVVLRGGESQDSLLKRFRKKVVKSGVLSTVRRKRWFVSKSEQRRMERKKAIRRIKRRAFTRDYE
jgi:small subunit ribosomal protein S21